MVCRRPRRRLLMDILIVWFDTDLVPRARRTMSDQVDVEYWVVPSLAADRSGLQLVDPHYYEHGLTFASLLL